MNILRRTSRGQRQLDHENRIQTLERRIPEEYPQLVSYLLGDVSTSVDGTFDFGFEFPDDEPCDLPNCNQDDWHTVGDALLLPQEYRGPFRVHLTASLTSGTTEIDNYLEAVTPANVAPTSNVKLFALCDIFDGEVYEDTFLSKAFEARGESPPPANVTTDRYWWYLQLASGGGISFSGNPTFRYAVRPQVKITGIAGAVEIAGIVLTVELLQERTALAGFSV